MVGASWVTYAINQSIDRHGELDLVNVSGDDASGEKLMWCRSSSSHVKRGGKARVSVGRCCRTQSRVSREASFAGEAHFGWRLVSHLWAAMITDAIHRACGWDVPRRRRLPPFLFIFLVEGCGGRSSWSSGCGVAGVWWPPSSLEMRGGG